MKIGIRKPSLKRSLKARTTGKLKRATKRAINPVYGKKGMGFVTNSKKAVYNKVYNKTTVGLSDISKSSSNSKSSVVTSAETINDTYEVNVPKTKVLFVVYRVLGILLMSFSLLLVVSGVAVIFGLICILFGILMYKAAKKYKPDDEFKDWD